MASTLDTADHQHMSKTFKFAKPQIPFDAIKEPWCVAMRKKRIFIYYKEELLPRYMFDRKHSEWVGQGVHLKSIRAIMEWVEKQPLKNIQFE